MMSTLNPKPNHHYAALAALKTVLEHSEDEKISKEIESYVYLGEGNLPTLVRAITETFGEQAEYWINSIALDNHPQILVSGRREDGFNEEIFVFDDKGSETLQIPEELYNLATTLHGRSVSGPSRDGWWTIKDPSGYAPYKVDANWHPFWGGEVFAV